MSRRNTKIWPRKEERKRKNGKCVREGLEEEGGREGEEVRKEWKLRANKKKNSEGREPNRK